MADKSNYSFIGGSIAFLLATSCCWLPWLAILLGGTTGLMGFSAGLEQYSGLLMSIGVLLFALAAYQFYQNKQKNSLQLQSTLTCPHCKHQKEETMPENACQFFYECEQCHTVLKPINGDCCVYCSFGSVPCPPIQKEEDCCT